MFFNCIAECLVCISTLMSTPRPGLKINSESECEAEMESGPSRDEEMARLAAEIKAGFHEM